MLYVMEHCTALISSLPLLQHDAARIEDLDTDAEDHAADDMRYACLARPWLPSARGERKVVPMMGYLPWRSVGEIEMPEIGAL
jgi:hypothetical protein